MTHGRTTRIIRTLVGCLLLISAAQRLVASDEHGHAAPDTHGHEDETFTVDDFERFGVGVAAAAAGQVDVGVDLPGEVRPNADRIAHIAPRFPGLVREVRKYVGDRVRAGEVLAIIESENLSPFELRTAFDGTIIDKHVAPGETVTREQPAFIVADLSTVWIDVTVYQAALPQVRVAQPAVITASAGGLETTGAVAYITPVVDQATRTARARIVVANDDGAWRPGLFVTATILDPVPAPIVIARKATHTIGGKPVVFVVEGDRFAVRPVRIGRVGRTKVEVVSGLAPGERFAEERSFLVKAELGKSASAHEH